MIIAIPSKGRAGKVTSHNLLGNASDLAIVFCPESEVAGYSVHHESVMGVPDDIKGIAPTRNWILDYAKAQDEQWIIQCDDDAIFFGFYEGEVKEHQDLQDNVKLQLFYNMFEMAEDCGTNLWGFNVSSDPLFYRMYHPLNFLTVIVGNMMGIIEDGQRFDERLVVKEDYDFSLQAASIIPIYPQSKR